MPASGARRKGAQRARARRCRACRAPTRCTAKGAIERGQEMPCSSAYCSTAAAAIRGRPDAIAAHHDRPLAARLVQIGRAERLRVARAELEDVADLDRRLDLDRAAERAAVAGLHLAHVGEAGAEVAAGLDPAQVKAARFAPVTYTPRSSAASASTSTSAPTGPMNPGSAPKVATISSSVEGRNSDPSALRELDLVHRVIAAHEH